MEPPRACYHQPTTSLFSFSHLNLDQHRGPFQQTSSFNSYSNPPIIIHRRAVEKPFNGWWAVPSGPLHFSVLISETWAPFQLALHLSSCPRPVDVRQLAFLSGQASRWPGWPQLGCQGPKDFYLCISTTLWTSVGHAWASKCVSCGWSLYADENLMRIFWS